MIRTQQIQKSPTTLLKAAHRSAPTPGAPAPAATPQDSVGSVPAPKFDLSQVRLQTQARAASLAKKLADHEIVQGEVLVRVSPNIGPLSDFAADYGAKVKTKFDIPASIKSTLSGEMMVLSLPQGLSVAEALAAMEEDGRVLAADSNDILRAVDGNGGEPPTEEPPSEDPPSEPPPPAEPVRPDDLATELWGLENTGQNGGTPGVDIKAAQAWMVTTGSRTGPIVAVIDSGVDVTHRDLNANIWTNANETADSTDSDGNGVVDDLHGFNAIEGSGNPVDQNGHGTHCAGTIGAVGNNGTGVTGVNWEAQIMPVKFLNDIGAGTTEDAIKGVLYATQMGARITSNSWAGPKYNQVLFDSLNASPALHICAAGNEGYNNDVRPVYPANYELDNIISVAAHDNQDRLATFSNRGEGSVDLAAPGVDIYSTEPGRGYKTLSGTSMATPHVAGVATLIATEYPGISNEDIKRRLLSGVDPMPEEYGRRLGTGGRMNAAKALEQDTAPPAQVADLVGSAVNTTSVRLNWSATGDDGMDGDANAYELRFSDRPIVEGEADSGEVAFNRAVPVRLPAPKAVGEAEEVVVPLAPSGGDRDLHFALKVLDNVGNKSPFSEVVVTVPGQPVALEDDMEGDATVRWDTDGTWGLVTEPGRGQVFTDSPDGEYNENTDSALTSKAFSLTGFENSKLYLDLKHDVEQKHDEVVVEVYGKRWFWTKWREVESFTGMGDFKTHQIDLSSYDGQDDLKVRVRLKTDDSRNRDGVYVDNLVITGDKVKN